MIETGSISSSNAVEISKFGRARSKQIKTWSSTIETHIEHGQNMLRERLLKHTSSTCVVILSFNVVTLTSSN